MKPTPELRVGGHEEYAGRALDTALHEMRNLVDNAAKYAHNGSAPRVHLEATVRRGTLSLSVRDHGPGIAAEQSRAIFEQFDRGGRDPSDPVPGIGLGLALARGMARDMGGDLTLDRSVDGGACFRLLLPTTDPDGRAS